MEHGKPDGRSGVRIFGRAPAHFVVPDIADRTVAEGLRFLNYLPPCRFVTRAEVGVELITEERHTDYRTDSHDEQSNPVKCVSHPFPPPFNSFRLSACRRLRSSRSRTTWAPALMAA